MYQDVLEKIGLNSHQSKVYYALLELGPSRMQEILKKIPSFKRGNLYNILRSLKKLNLVVEDQQNPKRTLFRPLPPHDLENLLDAQEKNIAFARTELNAVLPSLETLFTASTEKPGIQYFEGMDAVRKTYEDILRAAGKELLVFHAMFADEEAIGASYYQRYLRQKARQGIQTKILMPDTPEFRKLPENDPALKIVRNFIDQAKFKIPGDMAIYADKVAMLTIKGKTVGFIVENRSVAQSLKQIFHLVWEAY